MLLETEGKCNIHTNEESLAEYWKQRIPLEHELTRHIAAHNMQNVMKCTKQKWNENNSEIDDKAKMVLVTGKYNLKDITSSLSKRTKLLY